MAIRQILSDDALAAFRGRRPHAEPFAARAAVDLLDWEALHRVLADGPDLLVADRGTEVDLPRPRSHDEARRCLDRGASLVIRRAERHDPALLALASEFGEQFAASVHIQVFVTPAGQRSFGWHYDDEHVFVLQTVGSKQYWFRENTVVKDTARADFAVFAHEVSPLMTATLDAGDLLYLPRGHWHVAQARSESMHLSVGVRPDAERSGK